MEPEAKPAAEAPYVPFEENEISIKANGGTELIKRKIASMMDPEIAKEFQVICSRVREIRNDKLRIYWVHDLPEDPETNHLQHSASRTRFHRIVFCGHWQQTNYLIKLGIPQDEKILVIENGIEPIDVTPKDKELLADEVRMVYCATPHRGLNILVPVFIKLHEKYPNIRLHVYSSFQIYGAKSADSNFEGIYKICREHPAITYHGTASNEEVRKALKACHIYAYPSTWQECNSIATMEAMSAGLEVVHPNLAGLPDTTGGMTAMYQWHQDANTHANIFFANLEQAVLNVRSQEAQNRLAFIKQYADTRFHIERQAGYWRDLMGALVKMAEGKDRAPPPAMFQYRPFG